MRIDGEDEIQPLTTDGPYSTDENQLLQPIKRETTNVDNPSITKAQNERAVLMLQRDRQKKE